MANERKCTWRSDFARRCGSLILAPVSRCLANRFWIEVFLCLLLLSQIASSQTNTGLEEVLVQKQPGQMYESKGEVLFKPVLGAETNAAVPQPVGFNEVLRTLAFSEAAMRLSDHSHLRLWQLTRLQIIRQPLLTNIPTIKLYRGQIRSTSRGRVSTP